MSDLPDLPDKMAMARYLALAGVASRRAAETMITAGRVALNGTVVTALTTRVRPDEDQVTCDGHLLTLAARTYLLLNKPPGYVCSAQDEHAPRLVGELLPRKLDARVFSVGRLDMDSEGLLLFTDDGDLANRLTHPRYGIEKTYLVALSGEVTDSSLRQLEHGLEDDGEFLQVLRAELHSRIVGGAKLLLTIGEGKKREIRRMCRQMSWRVLRLQRIRLGPLELGQLPSGATRPLTAAEIQALRVATGLVPGVPSGRPHPAARPPAPPPPPPETFGRHASRSERPRSAPREPDRPAFPRAPAPPRPPTDGPVPHGPRPTPKRDATRPPPRGSPLTRRPPPPSSQWD